MSWETHYRNRLMTADEALCSVKSGMRVYIQPGCAEPETLVEALLRRGPEVHDVEIVHMMTMGCAPYVAPEMEGHFRHNAMFIGGNVREAINNGRADFTPIYLSEIEGLFESGAMPIDVALLELSPPDSHGFCSFGVGVDTSVTAAKVAGHVVAQINDQMPRTYGDSFIHVTDLDSIVESSRPLCALKRPVLTDLHHAIARNVAGLIDDGAVLQTGIGGIPDAVLPMLSDRKDLAVHSELVSDGVMPLIEAGVITGARKNFKPRKIILGFALGTEKLFEFLDNNPMFEPIPTTPALSPAMTIWSPSIPHCRSTSPGRFVPTLLATSFTAASAGRLTFCVGLRAPKAANPSSRYHPLPRTALSPASYPCWIRAPELSLHAASSAT